MPSEIERKFLIRDDSWRKDADGGALYRQAYFTVVRGTGRIRTAGGKGFITMKSPVVGCTRDEFEYEIPVEDADRMIDLFCQPPVIEKYRHIAHIDGFKWEIDRFTGDNEGLVVAEIELVSEDQPFTRPLWLGEEVTGQPQYYNSSLARNPFKNWRK